MLKTILMASAFTLTAPAFAQDTQQVPANPTTTVAQTPAQAAPVTPATPDAAQPTTQSTDVATATPAAPAAAAQPATGSIQIAQVVSTEFPSYDKNADTKLDKKEFGAWMVALKTASDPATKASDPATTKWIDGAFASADSDKSKSVTQAELTKYLSQGASGD